MKFKDGRGWGGGSETTAITKKVKYRVSREVPVAVVAREDVQSVVGRRRRQREHQTCAEEKERDSRQLERERTHKTHSRGRHDVHPVWQSVQAWWAQRTLNELWREASTSPHVLMGVQSMRKVFDYRIFNQFSRDYGANLLLGQTQRYF